MNQFEKFLLNHPLVKSTIVPLKENACILIETPQQKYYFSKVGTNPQLTSQGKDPDLTFISDEETLNSLFSNENLSIGEYGVKILEEIIRKKISPKISIGPIKFFSKGYLGVLGLGGKDFLNFLKSRGISLTDINKILKTFRS